MDDEGALDMATALSGSGPGIPTAQHNRADARTDVMLFDGSTAYFFLVAEAMIDTGVHMGFSRAVATVCKCSS